MSEFLQKASQISALLSSIDQSAAQAETRISSLVRNFQTLERTISSIKNTTIDINFTASNSLQQIREHIAEIKSIRSRKFRVQAEVEGLISLGAFVRRMEKLNALPQTYTFTIKVETASALAQLTLLQTKLNQISADIEKINKGSSGSQSGPSIKTSQLAMSASPLRNQQQQFTTSGNFVDNAEKVLKESSRLYGRIIFAMSNIGSIINGLLLMARGVKSMRSPDDASAGFVDVAGGIIRILRSLRGLESISPVKFLPKIISGPFTQRRSETVADIIEGVYVAVTGTKPEKSLRQMVEPIDKTGSSIGRRLRLKDNQGADPYYRRSSTYVQDMPRHGGFDISTTYKINRSKRKKKEEDYEDEWSAEDFDYEEKKRGLRPEVGSGRRLRIGDRPEDIFNVDPADPQFYQKLEQFVVRRINELEQKNRQTIQSISNLKKLHEVIIDFYKSQKPAEGSDEQPGGTSVKELSSSAKSTSALLNRVQRRIQQQQLLEDYKSANVAEEQRRLQTDAQKTSTIFDRLLQNAEKAREPIQEPRQISLSSIVQRVLGRSEQRDTPKTIEEKSVELSNRATELFRRAFSTDFTRTNVSDKVTDIILASSTEHLLKVMRELPNTKAGLDITSEATKLSPQQLDENAKKSLLRSIGMYLPFSNKKGAIFIDLSRALKSGNFADSLLHEIGHAFSMRSGIMDPYGEVGKTPFKDPEFERLRQESITRLQKIIQRKPKYLEALKKRYPDYAKFVDSLGIERRFNYFFDPHEMFANTYAAGYDGGFFSKFYGKKFTSQLIARSMSNDVLRAGFESRPALVRAAQEIEDLARNFAKSENIKVSELSGSQSPMDLLRMLSARSETRGLSDRDIKRMDNLVRLNEGVQTILQESLASSAHLRETFGERVIGPIFASKPEDFRYVIRNSRLAEQVERFAVKTGQSLRGVFETIEEDLNDKLGFFLSPQGAGGAGIMGVNLSGVMESSKVRNVRNLPFILRHETGHALSYDSPLFNFTDYYTQFSDPELERARKAQRLHVKDLVAKNEGYRRNLLKKYPDKNRLIDKMADPDMLLYLFDAEELMANAFAENFAKGHGGFYRDLYGKNVSKMLTERIIGSGGIFGKGVENYEAIDDLTNRISDFVYRFAEENDIRVSELSAKASSKQSLRASLINTKLRNIAKETLRGIGRIPSFALGFEPEEVAKNLQKLGIDTTNDAIQEVLSRFSDNFAFNVSRVDPKTGKIKSTIAGNLRNIHGVGNKLGIRFGTALVHEIVHTFSNEIMQSVENKIYADKGGIQFSDENLEKLRRRAASRSISESHIQSIIQAFPEKEEFIRKAVIAQRTPKGRADPSSYFYRAEELVSNIASAEITGDLKDFYQKVYGKNLYKYIVDQVLPNMPQYTKHAPKLQEFAKQVDLFAAKLDESGRDTTVAGKLEEKATEVAQQGLTAVSDYAQDLAAFAQVTGTRFGKRLSEEVNQFAEDIGYFQVRDVISQARDVVSAFQQAYKELDVNGAIIAKIQQFSRYVDAYLDSWEGGLTFNESTILPLLSSRQVILQSFHDSVVEATEGTLDAFEQFRNNQINLRQFVRKSISSAYKAIQFFQDPEEQFIQEIIQRNSPIFQLIDKFQSFAAGGVLSRFIPRWTFDEAKGKFLTFLGKDQPQLQPGAEKVSSLQQSAERTTGLLGRLTNFVADAAEAFARFGPFVQERPIDTYTPFAKEIYKKYGSKIVDFQDEIFYDFNSNMRMVSASARLANGAVVQLQGSIDHLGRVNIDNASKNILDLNLRFGEIIRGAMYNIGESLVYSLFSAIQNVVGAIINTQDDINEMMIILGANTKEQMKKYRSDFMALASQTADITGTDFQSTLETNILNLKLFQKIPDVQAQKELANRMSTLQLGAQQVFGLSKESAMRNIPAIFSEFNDSLLGVEDPVLRAAKAMSNIELLFTKMTVAQRASAAQGENLISIFSELLPSLSKFGMSIDDLLVLSAVSDVSLAESPAETVNILKMALERLTLPSNREELRKLGIDTTKGPIETLRQIYALKVRAETQQDRDAVQKYQRAITIAGEKRLANEVVKVVRAVGTNEDFIRKQIEGIRGDEYTRLLKARVENVSGQFNRLANAVTNFVDIILVNFNLLDLSADVLGNIADLINYAGESLRNFISAIDPNLISILVKTGISRIITSNFDLAPSKLITGFVDATENAIRGRILTALDPKIYANQRQMMTSIAATSALRMVGREETVNRVVPLVQSAVAGTTKAARQAIKYVDNISASERKKVVDFVTNAFNRVQQQPDAAYVVNQQVSDQKELSRQMLRQQAMQQQTMQQAMQQVQQFSIQQLAMSDQEGGRRLRRRPKRTRGMRSVDQDIDAAVQSAVQEATSAQQGRMRRVTKDYIGSELRKIYKEQLKAADVPPQPRSVYWKERVTTALSNTVAGFLRLNPKDAARTTASVIMAAAPQPARPAGTSAITASYGYQAAMARVDAAAAMIVPMAMDLMTKGPSTETFAEIGVGAAVGFIGALTGNPMLASIGYSIGAGFAEYVDITAPFLLSEKEKQSIQSVLLDTLSLKQQMTIAGAGADKVNVEKIRQEAIVNVENKKLNEFWDKYGFSQLRSALLEKGVDIYRKNIFGGDDFARISSEELRKAIETIESGKQFSADYRRSQRGDLGALAFDKLTESQRKDVEALAYLIANDPRFAELKTAIKDERLVFSNFIVDVAEALQQTAKDSSLFGVEIEEEQKRLISQEFGDTIRSVTDVMEEFKKKLSEANERLEALYAYKPYGGLMFGAGGSALFQLQEDYAARISAASGEEAQKLQKEYELRAAALESMPATLNSAISVFRSLGLTTGSRETDTSFLQRQIAQMSSDAQQVFTQRMNIFAEADKFTKMYEEKLNELQTYKTGTFLIDETTQEGQMYRQRIADLELEIELYREKYELSKAIVESAKAESNFVLNSINLAKRFADNREKINKTISAGSAPQFVAPRVIDVEKYTAQQIRTALQKARERQAKFIQMHPEYRNIFAKEQFIMEDSGILRKVAGISSEFFQKFLEEQQQKIQVPGLVDLSDMSREEIEKVVQKARSLQERAAQLAPEMREDFEKQRLMLLAKNNDLLLELGLSQDFLRAAIEDNTKSNELRGHYNLPAGYRPPTIWDYYAEGGTTAGEKNFPGVPGVPLELAAQIAQKTLEGQGKETGKSALAGIGDIIEPGSMPFFFPNKANGVTISDMNDVLVQNAEFFMPNALTTPQGEETKLPKAIGSRDDAKIIAEWIARSGRPREAERLLSAFDIWKSTEIEQESAREMYRVGLWQSGDNALQEARQSSARAAEEFNNALKNATAALTEDSALKSFNQAISVAASNTAMLNTYFARMSQSLQQNSRQTTSPGPIQMNVQINVDGKTVSGTITDASRGSVRGTLSASGSGKPIQMR